MMKITIGKGCLRVRMGKLKHCTHHGRHGVWDQRKESGTEASRRGCSAIPAGPECQRKGRHQARVRSKASQENIR